jgi:hypothetical protein
MTQAGILTVLGTCLLFFVMGHSTIWGSMIPYYFSYYKPDNPGLSAKDLALL